MQTPIPQHPYSPELFTRERRRTRVRQFLASFEKDAWTSIGQMSKLAPITMAGAPAKQQEWFEHAAR